MSTIIRLLPLLLLTLSPTAHAQEDDWLEQAYQINRDLVHKEDPDAHLLLRIQSNLAQQQDNPHHIALQANRHYTFFADCDRNCNRLGLILLHNGKTLQRSTTHTAFPMFSWHPHTSGRYILRVQMHDCHQQDCLYNITIFEGHRRIF